MEIPEQLELTPDQSPSGFVGVGQTHGFHGLHGWDVRRYADSDTQRVWFSHGRPVPGCSFEAPEQVFIFAVSNPGLVDLETGGATLHTTADVLPAERSSAALSAVGAAIPQRKRVPPWMDSTVSRMKTLMNLPSGWSGYGSSAVEPSAVAASIEAMLALDRDGRLIPSIVPTQDAGIQLEWHVGGVDLEAEFRPDGVVELWYSDPETGQEREEQVEQRDEAIRQLDALLTVVETRL